MAKKKRMTKAEREAWERHLDETVRNLRELAAGRAERTWRATRSAASS
jgi:hypothetical protein